MGSGANAIYSTDGINWTATAMPSNAEWSSVAYGSGKYVAVTNGPSNKAAYSINGINWVAATMPFSANWKSITYGNGRFVAIASSSKKVAYSQELTAAGPEDIRQGAAAVVDGEVVEGTAAGVETAVLTISGRDGAYLAYVDSKLIFHNYAQYSGGTKLNVAKNTIFCVNCSGGVTGYGSNVTKITQGYSDNTAFEIFAIIGDDTIQAPNN